MEIIALRGPANCGKTNTLGITYQLLLDAGYKQVPGHFSQEEAFNFLGEKVYGMKDFNDVLEKDGHLLGIATGEDSAKKLSTILYYFQNAGCDIAICSCTEDEENQNIIKGYSPHTFIHKTSETIDSLKRIHDWTFAKKIMAHLK